MCFIKLFFDYNYISYIMTNKHCHYTFLYIMTMFVII